MNLNKNQIRGVSKITKILVVDDDPQIIKSVLSFFNKSTEFNVFVADNGKKAIDIFIRNNIDIIVSDIDMPEINGFGVLENAKKIEIPTILISARNYDSTKVEALKAGAVDFFGKPLSIKDIVDSIRKHARQKSNKTKEVYECRKTS